MTKYVSYTKKIELLKQVAARCSEGFSNVWMVLAKKLEHKRNNLLVKDVVIEQKEVDNLELL